MPSAPAGPTTACLTRCLSPCRTPSRTGSRLDGRPCAGSVCPPTSEMPSHCSVRQKQTGLPGRSSLWMEAHHSWMRTCRSKFSKSQPHKPTQLRSERRVRTGAARAGALRGQNIRTRVEWPRAPAAARDFFSAAFVHLDAQDFRGAVNDDEQILRLVKIEPMHDAKARAQRGGDQSRARGSAYEREVAQWKRVNTRSRSLANNQVHAKVFHRGIEHFFDRRLQAMDFVEKENFFLLQRGQNCGKVAFALEQRSRAGLDGNV